jgi:hypothetical protein
MIFRQLFDQTSSTYSYILASRAGGEAMIIDPVLERVDRYLQLIRETVRFEKGFCALGAPLKSTVIRSSSQLGAKFKFRLIVIHNARNSSTPSAGRLMSPRAKRVVSLHVSAAAHRPPPALDRHHKADRAGSCAVCPHCRERPCGDRTARPLQERNDACGTVTRLQSPCWPASLSARP